MPSSRKSKNRTSAVGKVNFKTKETTEKAGEVVDDLMTTLIT
jgi:hypothetical protein